MAALRRGRAQQLGPLRAMLLSAVNMLYVVAGDDSDRSDLSIRGSYGALGVTRDRSGMSLRNRPWPERDLIRACR